VVPLYTQKKERGRERDAATLFPPVFRGPPLSAGIVLPQVDLSLTPLCNPYSDVLIHTSFLLSDKTVWKPLKPL